MQQISPGDHIVVLGGSGFIGSHIIPVLLEAGMGVTNYDLYDPIAPLPDQVEDIRGDIRDAAALRRALESADAVLNLAAAHHDFGLSPATFRSVNVSGAQILTSVMDELGINNLCFYSSVAVYGEGHQAPTEQTPPSPSNIYGQTKLQAEGVYQEWANADSSRRCLIVRPAVVFGPRNAANMYRLIDQIARRRFFPVGAGNNEKSMIYVENIVQAILYLWANPPACTPEVVNCVDEPNLKSAQIISAVYTYLGRKAPRWYLPLTPAIWAAKPLDLIARVTKRDLPITSNRIAKLGASETAFSAARLRSLGFSSTYSLRQGIERMVTWYQAAPHDLSDYTHLPPENPVIS